MLSPWDELILQKFGHDLGQKMLAFRYVLWKAAGYEPTPIQREVFEAARLTKLISGGVRAGKSFTSAMIVADFIAVPNKEIWLVGDTFEAAREEFNYLYRPLATIGLVPDRAVSMPDIGRWKMEVSGGATIITKSSQDISKLASVAPIAQVFTEAAQQNPDIFDKALERALQEDSFVCFSGTLEASKQLEFTNLLIKWKTPPNSDPHTPQSWSMPTWTNTRVFPGGKNDVKFKRMTENMTPEKFDERVAAVPYRPTGLVHKRFSEKNIATLQVDEDTPVHLAIDPGYTSYVVLFLQRVGEYVHVLDEIYRHEALTHDVIREAQSHVLWPKVNWGIIDIGARQHHSNESVWEVWRRLTGFPLVTRRVGIDDGIDAIETRCLPGEDGLPRLLISDQMKFDVDRNGRSNSLRGEFNLRRYPRYKTGKADGIHPIKANDHGLNALGYYLFHFYGQEEQTKEQPNWHGKRKHLVERWSRHSVKKQQPNWDGNKSRSKKLRFGRSRRRVR